MKTLIRNSKNLIDNLWKNCSAYWFQTEILSTRVGLQKLIPVKPSTYYSLSIPSDFPLRIAIQQYKEDGKTLTRDSGWKDKGYNNDGKIAGFSVQTESNTAYIWVITSAPYYERNVTVEEVQQYKIMLNEGDIALPYEPYNKISRLKMLINENENLAKDIPNRIDTGESQYGQRGFFESKNGVITFGGVITADSLQATYNVISQNTWVANYPNYYRLTENDLDIFPGTYTISMKVTAGKKNRISIVFGDVGTYAADKENTPAKIIYLKQKDQTKTNEFITQTFTIDRKMKFALLVTSIVDAVGEDTGTAIISDIILSKGTLVRNPKNLIPFPYGLQSGTTVNGVTLTYGDDGVIRLSGNSTSSQANFNLTNYNGKRIKLRAGIYTFSHDLPYDICMCTIGVFDKGNVWLKNITIYDKSVATFTVSKEDEENGYQYSFLFVVRTNANMDGLVDRFMLNEGTTAESYFVPQKITKMKPLMREDSKNLIPFPYKFTTKTTYGITTTVLNDGQFQVSGTNEAGDFVTHEFQVIKNLPAGTYTMSVSSVPQVRLMIQKRVKGLFVVNYTIGYAVGKLSQTFTVTEEEAKNNTYSCNLSFPSAFATSTPIQLYAMLNAGSTASPYEPYNRIYDDQSTRIRNPKNLIPFPYHFNSGIDANGLPYYVNNDGSITLDGYRVNGGSAYAFQIVVTRSNYKLEVGKTYTYTLHATDYPSGLQGVVQIYKGNSWVKNLGSSTNGKGFTFTVTEDMYSDDQYIRFNIYGNFSTAVKIHTTVYPILNEGSTAEPYYTRKKFITQSLNNIPSGYQEVEYIESTGTQLINTGYAPNITTRVELDTLIQNSSFLDSSSGGGLFGVSSGAADTGIFSVNFPSGSSGQLYFWLDKWDNTETTITSLNLPTDIRTTIALDSLNNVCRIGSTQTTVKTTMKGNCIQTMSIFGNVTSNGYTPFKYFSMKIYSVKIYNNDVLVRNFIPCYRKKDNKTGMYDTITKQFFTNFVSDDEFIVGSKIIR